MLFRCKDCEYWNIKQEICSILKKSIDSTADIVDCFFERKVKKKKEKKAEK